MKSRLDEIKINPEWMDYKQTSGWSVQPAWLVLLILGLLIMLLKR